MDITKGSKIVFTGYSQPPEDGEELLVAGESYEVVEVNKKENSVVVRVDNPDFKPKVPESAKNPKSILLDVFAEEFEVSEEEEVTKPGKAAKGRGKPAAPTQEEEEEEGEGEEEKVIAPAAGKAPKAAKTTTKPGKAAPGKAAPAKAVTKGKGKPAAKAKKANAADEGKGLVDPYADLLEENEDEEILGLVNEADSLLDLAKEVSEEASAVEYKLGGILFHVRKTGAYKEMDDRYAEKGGFSLYVLEQLNVEYRKAMYLIDIYYKWNKFGLDSAKVASIGWAKAAKIAAVMSEENADELIELAETNTVADLVANIKTSYKEVGAQAGTKKVLKTFKFRLYEDQAAAVEEVIQSTAASMGFTSLDLAFEHIIMEWATEHGVSADAES